MGKEELHDWSAWYVIQVSTGSEDIMCKEIERACKKADEKDVAKNLQIGLKECFNPKFASRKKRMGTWHDVDRTLLPGYVIADVRNPERLAHALSKTEEFCRLLSNEETYLPLDDAERRWLEGYTNENKRVVPLSYGFRAGNSYTVASGPLKGREALITRLDTKNCLAHVELHVGQITFKRTLGLVILPSGAMELLEG